ncbi:hypothetical protein HK097_009375 [Rhizophlyctis rosea]|uniref:Uncharacterized protein n=1 Tax=Rhizophlyctis rosea TaxID=64517 RepID=A0AAD5S918_9FUNG|nr:hypothetical protein HK097_009375 [Rhizophlyctis rosea]
MSKAETGTIESVDTAVSVPQLQTESSSKKKSSKAVTTINYVVIVLLFAALIAFAAYRVIEYRSQPTLTRLEPQTPDPSGKSPVPGFGLCCNVQTTAGGCVMNYAMPDGQPGTIQNTTDGKFTCLTYFKPSAAVLQNGPGNGWAWLPLQRTARSSPSYLVMFTSRVDIDSFPPDLIGDLIDDTQGVKVAYNIIKTVPLGSNEVTISTTISGIQSTRNSTAYLIFRATDSNPPINRQWQPIKPVGIVTDVLTFIGGTLLVIYYIVMGRGRYRSWGIVHQVVKATPAPVNADNAQDTARVLNEFLDVKLERKYF